LRALLLLLLLLWLLPLLSLLPPLLLHVALLLWPATLPPLPSTSPTCSPRTHALLLLAAPATPPRPVGHGPLLLLWPVTLGTNTRLVSILRPFTFFLDEVVKAHVELLLC
jgi:hypothetical protein